MRASSAHTRVIILTYTSLCLQPYQYQNTTGISSCFASLFPQRHSTIVIGVYVCFLFAVKFYCWRSVVLGYQKVVACLVGQPAVLRLDGDVSAVVGSRIVFIILQLYKTTTHDAF